MGEKHTCCAEVWRGTEWRPRKEACGCKASVERDCKWYCKRHDPVALAEKQEAQDNAWREEWAAKAKRYRLEQTAPDLLAALKAILPMAVLGSERDGYCFDRRCEGCPGCQEQLKKARAAIRKADGES